MVLNQKQGGDVDVDHGKEPLCLSFARFFTEICCFDLIFYVIFKQTNLIS